MTTVRCLRYLYVGVYALLSMAMPAWAQEPAPSSSILAQAELAYDEARFADAIRLYQELRDSGVENGHLYFNLGNAYYRAGQQGEAVAAYLAARHYLPRDPDVRANLKYVLGQNQDKVSATVDHGWMATLFFWTGSMTGREQAWTLAWLLALALTGLAAAIGRPTWQRVATPLTLASLLMASAFGAGMWWRSIHAEVWASVVVDQADVLSGPSEKGNATLFAIHRGTPILIEGRSGSWYKVRLGDDKRGWIPESQVVSFLASAPGAT